jgi:hypothetical protein
MMQIEPFILSDLILNVIIIIRSHIFLLNYRNIGQSALSVDRMAVSVD